MDATTSAAPIPIDDDDDVSQLTKVLPALLVALFLSALDNTIVATAMPTIVGKMGGFSKYAWVTTSYVVTSTVATLLLGKLSDILGRRRIYLFAIGMFLVASILCGLATSMNELIAARALQGLGGGGIWGLTFTIVGDLVAPAKRGKYFGTFTSMFALAGLAGPLVGGAIVDNFSWRWIFFVNIPLAVYSFAKVFTVLHLPRPTNRKNLDIPGAVLVTAIIGFFMLILEEGPGRGWSSPEILGGFALCLALIVVFVLCEQRAADPVLPMHLFKNPVLRNAYILAVLVGMTMMAVSIFFALYFQDVRFYSPTKSGLLGFPQMLGVTIASAMTGRLITKTGKYKKQPLIGTLVAAAGFFAISRIEVATPYFMLALAMLMIGIGTGMTMPMISISTQNSGDPKDLGIVTATGNFFRTLGSAIGLAFYGTFLTSSLTKELTKRLPGEGERLSGLIREPRLIKALAPNVRQAVQESISTGIGKLFLIASVLTVVAFFAALSVEEQPLRSKSGLGALASMAE
jgi:EmrB/QacA subfamily drug resistance transporter